MVVIVMQNLSEQQLKDKIKKCRNKVDGLLDTSHYSNLIKKIINILSERVELITVLMKKKINASRLDRIYKQQVCAWANKEMNDIIDFNTKTVNQLAPRFGELISDYIDRIVVRNTAKFCEGPEIQGIDADSNAWIDDLFHEVTCL